MFRVPTDNNENRCVVNKKKQLKTNYVSSKFIDKTTDYLTKRNNTIKARCILLSKYTYIV